MRDGLMLSFTEKEMDFVLSSMKVDTTPRPDGLLVCFFKRFCHLVRTYILAISNDFALGRVDISRLNLGSSCSSPKFLGRMTFGNLDLSL